MLTEMRIQGLGVIDEAVLDLHPGLTVLSGETGAGKTMVVTGLHLLSGGRADASRVRSGATRAVVDGRLHAAADSPAGGVADTAGARFDDDGSLIASRTVGADGRSRAHLGGRAVPAGVLAELADGMLAVHGQNDQLRLLRPAEQRAVLDRFGGTAVSGPLAAYRETRRQWIETVDELEDRTQHFRERAREADLLQHGLDEIAAVDPQPEEDAALVTEARRLADADQLREAADAARYAIAGGEAEADAPTALGLIGAARERLRAVEDPQLRASSERLDQVAVQLADVAGELTGFLDGLQADPERLQQVLARQAELKTLTRKYAADVAGILTWAEQARGRLGELDTSEQAMATLRVRRDELASELAGHAAELSEARSAAANELESAVTAELSGLAMAEARLEVAVTPSAASEGSRHALPVAGRDLHAGPDGTDDVQLRLVAHPGGKPIPLHKGASGGELSRVMLALEVALADADPVPTLVFDEVDAGVGGRAAVEIGRRLARLAANHQVVVVTHLPQVAAYADRHLVVDKTADGAPVTGAGVRELDEDARVVELARMLAGLDDTASGRAHAEELLHTAAEEKDRK